MKPLLLVLLFSLFGTIPSETRISYRPLSWNDFRGPVSADEPYVAARTTAEITLETTQVGDDDFSFVFRAAFLPDSSFVRVRNAENLRHEQTHFKIACIEAKLAMNDVASYQHGGTDALLKAEKIYNDRLTAWHALNASFDAATNHGLNNAAEKEWEDKISIEFTTLGAH